MTDAQAQTIEANRRRDGKFGKGDGRAPEAALVVAPARPERPVLPEGFKNVEVPGRTNPYDFVFTNPDRSATYLVGHNDREGTFVFRRDADKRAGQWRASFVDGVLQFDTPADRTQFEAFGDFELAVVEEHAEYVSWKNRYVSDEERNQATVARQSAQLASGELFDGGLFVTNDEAAAADGRAADARRKEAAAAERATVRHVSSWLDTGKRAPAVIEHRVQPNGDVRVTVAGDGFSPEGSTAKVAAELRDRLASMPPLPSGGTVTVVDLDAEQEERLSRARAWFGGPKNAG